MKELFNLGLSESTIKDMIELNPEIRELSEIEVQEKIILLEKINCSKLQIINIIGSNSSYLTRTNEEIINLIKCLIKYGFRSLNTLIDSNPYILNLDLFEIDNYIYKRKKSGETLEEIVEDLDLNPYLFNDF